MFGHQVAPQRCRLATIEVVWHCIGIYQSDEHSKHDCRSLQHTFTAPCWQVSCLRSRFFANSQVTFGHQVAPQRWRLATIVLVWQCIGVYQSDEHSQHDCKSLHHTFMARRLRFSSLRWVKVSFSHRLLENLATSSGGMPSCGCYNSGCLALYMCITSP